MQSKDKLLRAYKQRLEKLYLRKAREGNSVDPSVLEEIAETEQRISQLSSSASTSTIEEDLLEKDETTKGRHIRLRKELKGLEKKRVEVDSYILRAQLPEKDALLTEKTALVYNIEALIPEDRYLERKLSLEEMYGAKDNTSVERMLIIAEEWIDNAKKLNEKEDFDRVLLHEMISSARKVLEYIIYDLKDVALLAFLTRAYIDLAEIYLVFLGSTKQALEYCDKNIDLAPNSIEAYEMRIKVQTERMREPLYKRQAEASNKHDRRMLRRIRSAQLLQEIANE